MIRLENISKSYVTRNGPRKILDQVEISIERGAKIGILGNNGAGKSTLIRIISGAEIPDSGKIFRQMSVSWPLAFSGAFQGSLSGLDNLKFITRVYGIDLQPALEYVKDFTELGAYLREPVRNYSSGMRARLAFAISMTVEFDCYLVDEVIAVGDSRFQEKCRVELFEKRADRALILVSHQMQNIRKHCTRASVLKNGQLHHFDDVPQAEKFHHTE